MYGIYQDEFFVSEQELKDKIYYYLQHLSNAFPEEFSADLVQTVEPSRETSEIVAELAELPFIQEIRPFFDHWDNETILRNLALELSNRVEAFDLESLYIRHFYKRLRIFFVSLRYSIITQIMTEKLNKTPITKNPGAVQKLIWDRFNDRENFLASIIASDKAEEEIEAFLNDDANQEYIEIISNFEYAIYEHIKKYGYNLCAESFVHAFFEGTSKNADLIDREFAFSEPLTDKEIKEFLKDITKASQQFVRQRIGIKDGRGGSHKSKGFVWNDQCKIEFYKTVGSLPKIKDKMLWDYAYEKLNEEDFNYKYIEYLRTETAFRDVPEFLFREAVKTWSKYKDSFNKPKPIEKPIVFALFHALQLLKYPQTKFQQ